MRQPKTTHPGNEGDYNPHPPKAAEFEKRELCATRLCATRLEDLLKAHIRVVAAQRNANALSANLREAQQQVEVLSRRFQELRGVVEAKTGMRYNEETLALESRK